MARDIPATYDPADPDRSFVPGSGAVTDDSPAGDPHGGGDIASNVRYLYANAAAVHVVPQIWAEDQWFGRVAAGFSATPEGEWLIYPDEAFETYEVTVYYEANVALAAGFRVQCKDNGQFIDLQTLAAGGADRRVRGLWTTSAIAGLAGADSVTLQLFTAGDGASSNEVKAVYIRRVPQTGTIAAGKHYSGSFITPDSSQWEGDKPLTSDKVHYIKQGLLALLVERRVPYVVYAAIVTQTEEYIDMLCPLHASDFGRQHRYHGYASAGVDVTVYTSPDHNDGHWTYEFTHLATTSFTSLLTLSNAEAFTVPGRGWAKSFGTYVLHFSVPSAAHSHTIEGP